MSTGYDGDEPVTAWLIQIRTEDSNLAPRILDNVPGVYELEAYDEDAVNDMPLFAGKGTPSPLTDPTGTPPLTIVDDRSDQ